ncbi:sensor histidine kinase [Paenibacillus cymbidii]|uniref:sensor histidine kinase n=1 Tax=Paenibacillus cymbidii TaxID=1639034 RepID=UPI001080DDBE|nr:histidine kinase [Paenibacillus cymbidii]
MAGNGIGWRRWRGWRPARKRLQVRFYNRLMLYTTLIFLAVAYLLAFLAARYATQLEAVKQLQQSRDALSAVFGYYERKNDNFLNIVYTLYDTEDIYATISEMLESPSDAEYENNALVKQQVVRTMAGLAVQDRDISSIVLFKNLTGSLYVYNTSKHFLERVGPDYPLYAQMKQMASGRYITGTRTVVSGSMAQMAYGISGTLGSKNIRLMAGQLLIEYNTQAIENIFQEYAGKTLGQFVIVSGSGDVVFNSEGGYGGEPYSQLDVLKDGAESATIDGKRYYVQTIVNDKRDYIGANLVPKEEVDRKSAYARRLIYAVFTALAFVCVVLYTAAGTFVSRRVNELIKGMKRISTNHLSYRIPLPKRSDEFAEIAARFNLMCDELQLIIHREYISELKKKNAELNALQAGINPHFLYNTLEAIRIKASDDGNRDIAEMIVLLAHLYRSVVRDRTFIPVRKEISMCDMYLHIFSLRYASCLEYDINVEHRVMEYGLPKNLLQPIVENYFVHGIGGGSGEAGEGSRFLIEGRLEEGDIVFRFEDNGRGMSEERLDAVRRRLDQAAAQADAGYGLANVHERIRLVYGEPYGLSVESRLSRETRITVRIAALSCEELERRLLASGEAG